MYMDDIKPVARSEKEQENLIHTVKIFTQYIGMKFGRKNEPRF